MCVVKQAWCFYTGFFYLRNALCALCGPSASFASHNKLHAKTAKKRKGTQRDY